MRFVVHAEVFERFPGLRIATVATRGIASGTAEAEAEVEARWRAAWDGAREAAAPYGNAQSHPRVRPWRERFTAMGVSGKQFPSSVEALLRRAMKGGAPFTINPLVDFYNAVSLRHTVPAGGFDLADLRGPVALRLTRPGDTFLALDADTKEPVPPGEVAYADGATILTRHLVWRQSRAGLLRPETRDALLLSEVLGEVGPETAEAVLADLREGMAALFGATTTGMLVDAEHAAFEW